MSARKEHAMQVYGVTVEQVESVAQEVGVRLYNLREGGSRRKPFVAFTLKTGAKSAPRIDWRGKAVLSPRYQRLSQREKQSTARGYEGETYNSVVPGAVCWHGHRDFMRALLRFFPTAEIRTAMARYRGLGEFEATHRATYEVGGDRMGMHMTPYGQACTCIQD